MPLAEILSGREQRSNAIRKRICNFQGSCNSNDQLLTMIMVLENWTMINPPKVMISITNYDVCVVLNVAVHDTIQ